MLLRGLRTVGVREVELLFDNPAVARLLVLHLRRRDAAWTRYGELGRAGWTAGAVARGAMARGAMEARAQELARLPGDAWLEGARHVP